jgi:hypothetical protein
LDEVSERRIPLFYAARYHRAAAGRRLGVGLSPVGTIPPPSASDGHSRPMGRGSLFSPPAGELPEYIPRSLALRAGLRFARIDAPIRL